MLKKHLLFYRTFNGWLCAKCECDNTSNAKMQVEKVDKALQKAKLTDIYVKMIKLFVLYTPRIKIQKNLHYVTVTFQGVSEKLTLMISERGKITPIFVGCGKSVMILVR